MRYRCVASPAFAQRWFGDGLSADTVRLAPGLNFDRKDKLLERFIGRHTGHTGRYPYHSLSSSEGFVRFITAGLGYGMLPVQQCDAGLDAGVIVDLAPGSWLDVPLVWHAWDIQTPFTRALTDSIVRTAKAWLIQPDQDAFHAGSGRTDKAIQ
jgi:LysR family transcriptional regulator (chromosome initiation inhibitor)